MLGHGRGADPRPRGSGGRQASTLGSRDRASSASSAQTSGERLDGGQRILVAPLGELDDLVLDRVGPARDPGTEAHGDASLDVPGVGRHPQRRLARAPTSPPRWGRSSQGRSWAAKVSLPPASSTMASIEVWPESASSSDHAVVVPLELAARRELADGRREPGVGGLEQLERSGDLLGVVERPEDRGEVGVVGRDPRRRHRLILADPAASPSRRRGELLDPALRLRRARRASGGRAPRPAPRAG